MSASVLLVEDHPDDVLFIRRAFRRAKLAVDLAVVSDGERAVEHLRGAGPPDLVLLDLKLPRLSGLEVLVWLRSQPALALVPVVVLTSSGQARDVRRAYEAGANSYLVKPVQAVDLDRMVGQLGSYWLQLNLGP